MQHDRRVLWHLKRIPLLRGLPPEEHGRIAPEVGLEEHRRRRVIYMPGDPGDCVYVVNSGQVKISRVTPDGKALTLAYRGSGEPFGELCILDASPREEMAEVVETALVTRIPREVLQDLLARHLVVSNEMGRTLAVSRRSLERKMEDLVFKDVNAKLAELLLDLSAGADEEERAAVPVKMTHQEMANLIGSTRETVSLTLSQFKRKKLIQTHSRKVMVTDAEGLRALT